MPTRNPHTERLVVGVDSSDHASQVLTVATMFARRLDLALEIVHSSRPDARLTGKPAEALAWGRELIDALDPTGESDERVVQNTAPAELLLNTLDGAALGVVGSRGRGTVTGTLLGSVSQEVARSAPCPVIVVPPHATINPYGNPTVVCGLDGSAHSTKALQAASTLASALGSPLVPVHVQQLDDPFAQGAAVDQSARMGVITRAAASLESELSDVELSPRLEHGDPALTLSAIAAQQPAGAILVVGSRGHGPLRSALMGSVSQWLASHASAPVMIVSPSAGALSLADSPKERAWTIAA